MDILKFVCDIIKHEMNLEDDQIWIYNQKVDIPSDNRLYVSVRVDEEDVFGSQNTEETQPGFRTKTEMNVVSTVSITMYSNGTKALINRYNLVGALRSVYSIQKQEESHCQIGRLPILMMDSSFAEPTAKLYSFHYKYRITHKESTEYKDIDFYSNFRGQVSFDSLDNTKDF